jgi:hypothetical protein
MKKEFNELVETLKRWDLYFKGDEVDIALTDLEKVIDEVEKRIECAVRSAKEINELISKYTDDVDNDLPINMSVNDHDLIQNCSNDVNIALDMDDDMCVSDNWYYLFSPKEEPKPIAVLKLPVVLSCNEVLPNAMLLKEPSMFQEYFYKQQFEFFGGFKDEL